MFDGMFDWLQKKEEKRKPPPKEDVPIDTKVVLHIYDVSGHSAVTGANKFFRAIGTGAYHAGVEINGKEWSYGCSDSGLAGSGIFPCDPKDCGAHEYRESQFMGHTTTIKKKSDLDALLKQMASEWQGPEYDLLRHNCCHFCDDLTRRLGVGPCPGWLTNLAGVGAMLRSGIRLVARAPGNAVGAIQAAPGAIGELFANKSVPEDREYCEQEYLGWPSVGDRVEIFSNSAQTWCRGKVEERDGDMVTVGYTQPGSDQLVNKTVPSDFEGLRPCFVDEAAQDTGRNARSSTQGYGQSKANQRYTSERGNDATARASYQEQTARAYQEYTARPSIHDRLAAEERKPLQVQVAEGDSVEVWSNSQKSWCPGYVERIRGNLIALAYQVPGAAVDDWARKVMASDSKEWRRINRKLDYGIPENVAIEFDVGDDVEVFSNSKKVWCPGRVTKRRKDVVTVCFQIGGAEEWVEKDVRLGDDRTLRAASVGLVGDSQMGSQMGGDRASVVDDFTLAFSDIEKECYEREFVEVLFADVTQRVVVTTSSVANGGQVAAHLARSGLPRKALKEIWIIGNPQGAEKVKRSMFFTSCRLVAHCQLMEGGKKALLEEGGQKLAGCLQQCLHTVPRRLPDFTVDSQVGI